MLLAKDPGSSGNNLLVNWNCRFVFASIVKVVGEPISQPCSYQRIACCALGMA